MWRTLLYLRLTWLRNALVTRTQRLRQPKYLAGAVVTVFYFYYFIFHRLGGSQPFHNGGATGEFAVISSLGVIVLMIGWVAVAWLFPPAKPALRFSPAEVNFLFPAPISRKTLVNYSLLSSQLKISMSAIIFGLLWSRHGFTLEGAAMRTVGWWLMFSAADLHKSCANLTYARLQEQGRSAGRAKAIAFAVALAFVAAVAASLMFWGRLPGKGDLSQTPNLARYASSLLATGPLRWLLWPFRALAGPFIAADGRDFAAALAPALLIVAAHYVWITRLEVSFAEGSVAGAEKSAQAAANRNAGLSTSVRRKARPGPFRLGATGRPEVAFLWKNLISISSTLNWRLLLIATVFLVQIVVIAVALSARGHGEGIDATLLVLAISGIVSVYTLLLGPQLARQDLRADLGNADILKSYPLPGWQVVLGQMLTPIAILSCVLWIMILAAASATWVGGEQVAGMSRAVAFTGAACAAAAAPLICGLELLVPNAAMLLFPAWHKATRTRTGGIETMGQRLIFVFGQVLAILLLLLPAVVAGGLVIAAAVHWIGMVLALIAGSLVAIAVLASEFWSGLWLVGQLFEKLDITAELRP